MFGNTFLVIFLVNLVKKAMIYGYIRVSTDKQTVENQRFEIKRFCAQEMMNIDGWIEESVSGTRNHRDRRLGTLLGRVKSGDFIVCSELSRLGSIRGSKNLRHKMTGKEQLARDLFEKGVSVCAAARQLKVGRNTLYRWMAEERKRMVNVV